MVEGIDGGRGIRSQRKRSRRSKERVQASKGLLLLLVGEFDHVEGIAAEGMNVCEDWKVEVVTP